MIIDYIGQEPIWNLTAAHPYKQNNKFSKDLKQ